MDGPHVSLAELKFAVTRLLDRVEREHGSTPDLGADHYWTLAGPTAYDPEPARPTVGQLSDDVVSVGQLAAKRDDELVVWHDLVHVTAILQRLAVLDLPKR